MPRPKKDHFAPLRPIVQMLSRLTHDEARDLADMLQADIEPDRIPSRKGLPPLDVERGHPLILEGGWQYRDNPPFYTKPARRELRSAYQSASLLSPEAQWLIIDIARALQIALAPVEKRRRRGDGTPIAEGHIETKIIYRKVWNNDTQEVEKRPYGPYLYYRYWASAGDADRRRETWRSEYIGAQALALLFDQTDAGSEARRELERRIIQAHKTGTIEALTKALGVGDPEKPDEG